MVPLFELLEGLLRHHGHRVTPDAALEGRSGTVYTVPLLAESSGHALLLQGADDPRAEMDGFAAVLADTGADLGVLVHTGSGVQGRGRIQVWGRDEMARLVGEWQVADSLGETAPELPLAVSAAESLAEVLPAAFQDVGAAPAPESSWETSPSELEELLGAASQVGAPVPEAAPVVNPSLVPPPSPAGWNPWSQPKAAAPFEPFAGDGRRPPLEGPALTAAPALASRDTPALAASFAASLPSSPPAAAAFALPTMFTAPPVRPVASPAVDQAALARALPPAQPFRTHPVLPARLDASQAQRKVAERLFGARVGEVVLHPVHLFDYEVDLLREGSLASDTEDGRIQVHAADKSILAVDPDTTNPQAPDRLDPQLPVSERVLRISAERAAELATQHVAKLHTRSIEVRVPDHQNHLFYTERRKVEPDASQIRLRHLGTYFRPAYRLVGENGQVDIDAVDGRELFAQVRGGRTDAVLMD